MQKDFSIVSLTSAAEMAASGPSQRKISVSTLVYSTLGPSLGLLPNEEKAVDPSLNAGGEEKKTGSAEPAAEDQSARPQRKSGPSEIQYEGNQKANKSSLVGSNGDLSRLYSSPASSFGEKGRLEFKSKAGAGSMSSMEQATLPKQSSVNVEDGAEAPPLSPVSKQLQNQISLSGEQPLSPR